MPPPPFRSGSAPTYHFKLNFGWVMRGLVAIVLIWAFFSCFAQVPADSVGVIQRLGRFKEEAQPGLVWLLPFGIDQLTVVPVQRQLKLEFGFSTKNATDEFQGSREPQEESTMVTGDLNMALVRWVVQYRIQSAHDFLFNVREPKATLRDATESVMREVVGDRTVDEVLTIGREEVETETLQKLKALSVHYGLGIQVIQVQLGDVHPPEPVQASFNEVNQAQQEREQAINVARGEYNKAVPRTRGEAEQKLTEAEGYALRRVNEARGDADRFQAQYAEYVKAPEVTRTRLYLEMMTEVLPQLERKIILDDKAGQLMPLLPLTLDGKPQARPISR